MVVATMVVQVILKQSIRFDSLHNEHTCHSSHSSQTRLRIQKKNINKYTKKLLKNKNTGAHQKIAGIRTSEVDLSIAKNIAKNETNSC